MDPPVSAIARAWSGVIWRSASGVGPCAFEPRSAVCDRSSGFVAIRAARLTVADVVGGVVHELHGADAALIRLLEPLELAFEEVEPLDVDDDGRLPGRVGGAEIVH